MRKMMVIAVRDYLAAVRTKAFIISVVFIPLLIGVSVGIPLYLQKMESRQVKVYGIVDRTAGRKILAAIKEKARRRSLHEIKPDFSIKEFQPSLDNPVAVKEQRFQLSEKVRHNMLTGFLDIGPDVYRSVAAPLLEASLSGVTAGNAVEPPTPVNERTAIRYQAKNPAVDIFPRWAVIVVNQAVQAERCRRAGVPPDKIQAILPPVPLVIRGLSIADPAKGIIEDASGAKLVAPLVIPAGLMAIMLLMIMVGSSPLMHGVVEEKMQRIAEVLLGSVRPFTLMMGKLIGTVAVSMTIAAVYLTSAYWIAYGYGVTEYLSVEVLCWFVVFQMLAVLMYGSLFIAIGAACTDMKETQTFLPPVMLLACLPMFMVATVIQNPNSTIVMGSSFFPPATPMLMIARLAVPPGIAWWQPVVGALAVLGVTLLCVYAAGRIFRVGLLMQGKGARISEMARWIFRG